jgi:tetratricopeptide (TPR) repeat protein
VGLLAFAFHLGVDFHTKLPALAFAAAISAGLLLRDGPWLRRPAGRNWARGIGLGLGVASVMIATKLAAPLYQAEALRHSARRAIDKNASTGQGDLRQIIPAAGAGFEQAVKIDPTNGQAWSDLSYASVLGWHVAKSDLRALGRRAEQEADRALARCAINAEFWVRKGVALDMQARQTEGGRCFKRAVELAPNSSVWWYHYAYHLSVFPERKPEALQAVQTCLTLDPSNHAAVALQKQLTARR